MNGPAHFTNANPRSPAAMMMVVMVMPTMVMMTVPAMVMVTMPAMMAMSPSRLCRLGLDILLDGGGSAGVAQRQRVSALGRSGYNEHGANGGKPQNFHHLHM